MQHNLRWAGRGFDLHVNTYTNFVFQKKKSKSFQTFMCSAYIESLPDKKIPYILLVTKIFI